MQQAFIWCTVLSAAAFAFAAARIAFLPKKKEYRVFSLLLLSWFGISVLSVSVPLTSELYFEVFLIAVPLSWVLYLLAAWKLYQKVFSNHPGIAFAGRSSLRIAAALVVAAVALSIAFSPSRVSPRLLSSVVLFLDRCVLFGVSFFLVLLVIVIVRYPISIAKNIAIHSFFFSFVLLSQTLLQVADQWTSYTYTLYCDTLAASFDAIIVTAWALVLTSAGDTAIIRIREHLAPETELALMGQLEAINGILLRGARK